MIYRGQVQGDVIVMANGVRLPDGLQVLIEPLPTERTTVPPSQFALRNGVPVFPNHKDAPAATLELVNSLRDDAP
jgi:hypothetical protein